LVIELEQRLARHVDALVVFPVAGQEVRRPGVFSPKAKRELLKSFTVRGHGVELAPAWLIGVEIKRVQQTRALTVKAAGRLQRGARCVVEDKVVGEVEAGGVSSGE
jgi:hypothetical protein